MLEQGIHRCANTVSSGNASDTDRLAALLHDLYVSGPPYGCDHDAGPYGDYVPRCIEDAARLIAAGVTIDAEDTSHEVELRAAFLRGEEFANARHAALVEAAQAVLENDGPCCCSICGCVAHDALRAALIEEARK
jgi:hypothetical protein